MLIMSAQTPFRARSRKRKTPPPEVDDDVAWEPLEQDQSPISSSTVRGLLPSPAYTPEPSRRATRAASSQRGRAATPAPETAPIEATPATPLHPTSPQTPSTDSADDLSPGIARLVVRLQEHYAFEQHDLSVKLEGAAAKQKETRSKVRRVSSQLGAVRAETDGLRARLDSQLGLFQHIADFMKQVAEGKFGGAAGNLPPAPAAQLSSQLAEVTAVKRPQQALACPIPRSASPHLSPGDLPPTPTDHPARRSTGLKAPRRRRDHILLDDRRSNMENSTTGPRRRSMRAAAERARAALIQYNELQEAVAGHNGPNQGAGEHEQETEPEVPQQNDNGQNEQAGDEAANQAQQRYSVPRATGTRSISLADGGQFRFVRNPRSVRGIWEEWHHGVPGQLSLESLEGIHGATWRTSRHPDKKTRNRLIKYRSDYVKKRHLVVEYIKQLATSRDIDPKAACELVDDIAEGRVHKVIALLRNKEDPLLMQPKKSSQAEE